MRIALVYDRVNKWGGAERVLLSLHKLFPDAPLFTSVYDRQKALWAKIFDVKTSFLKYFPIAKTSHELFALFMPVAFESFSFDEFDVVISITSEAAKGIITKPHTLHICICLTPTRYLWSGYDEYFSNSAVRFFSKPVIAYLRSWDLLASKRPDFYIAISNNVRNRIKKYYRRDSSVIYPPLTLRNSKFQNLNSRAKYYLVVSRLSRFTPQKRIDLAIRAANKLKIPLKIIGSGDINYFKSICGPTVEFLGGLTDQELSYYYKNCVALIFPGEEDFGLVMVEAQSFGKPVIAYRKGGAQDIVITGKTGEFFDQQTVGSLMSVLEKFDPKRYNREDCIENAKRFSFERFEREFMKYFNEKMKEYFK